MLLNGGEFAAYTAWPGAGTLSGMNRQYGTVCNLSIAHLSQVLLPATGEQGIEVASGNTGQGGYSGRKLAATHVKLDYTSWIGAVQVRKVRGFLHQRTESLTLLLRRRAGGKGNKRASKNTTLRFTRIHAAVGPVPVVSHETICNTLRMWSKDS